MSIVACKYHIRFSWFSGRVGQTCPSISFNTTVVSSTPTTSSATTTNEDIVSLVPDVAYICAVDDDSDNRVLTITMMGSDSIQADREYTLRGLIHHPYTTITPSLQWAMQSFTPLAYTDDMQDSTLIVRQPLDDLTLDGYSINEVLSSHTSVITPSATITRHCYPFKLTMLITSLMGKPKLKI